MPATKSRNICSCRLCARSDSIRSSTSTTRCSCSHTSRPTTSATLRPCSASRTRWKNSGSTCRTKVPTSSTTSARWHSTKTATTSSPPARPASSLTLQSSEPAEEPTAKIVGIDTDTDDTEAEYVEEEEEADVVRIKYTWIRNAVAAAAILIAVFILALPTGKTDLMQRTISNLNNGLLFGMMSEDTNTSKIEIQKVIREHEGTKARGSENSLSSDTGSNADSITQSNIVPSDSEKLSPETPNSQITPQKQYCIVLASYVSMHNARAFIERLQKQGYEQAEIFERNNIRRVIYGHYASENDAYNDLRRFHRQSETAEAWVMSL